MDQPIGPEICSNETSEALYRTIHNDPSIRIIVEIGAGCGQGSTRVIADALKGREGAAFYPIEASRGRMSQVVALYMGYPHVHPVLASTCSVEEFPSEATLHAVMVSRRISQYDFETAKRWRMQDIEYLRSHPELPTNALERVPRDLDLILIDGSEFLGWVEFQKVFHMFPKYIALDDIFVFKNIQAFEILSQSPVYTPLCVYNIRNGFAIFARTF
jgi:hypothetical protein